MAAAEAAVRTDEAVILQPAIDGRPPDPLPAVAAQRAATMSTLDGDVITHGVAALRGTAEAWTATLAHLDQPGAVATAYFARGIREVMLSLNDGRAARARFVATSFAPGADRTCELRGLEPLRHGAAA